MGRIYDDAAPSVASTMDEKGQEFLSAVLSIIRRTVEDAGGTVEEV